MKIYLGILGVILVAVVLVFTVGPEPELGATGDFYYTITNAGVVSGYAVIDTSRAVIDGRDVIVLEQTVVSQSRLLGMDVDATIELEFHIDPATGRFAYHAFEVDQGDTRITGPDRLPLGPIR